MTESFEKISKHLYRRQYQTAGGEWSTLYYGIFVDHTGKRQRFPLGDNLDDARDKLGDYRRKNNAEFDFDKAEGERKAKEMTFSRWAAQCEKNHEDKTRVRLHLDPFFGSMPLAKIDDEAVKRYRDKRSTETVIRHGERSKKAVVSQTTINKEVSTLRKLLRLARKKGFTDQVTDFQMAQEKARKRILAGEEYQALLEHCPPWLRRVCVMAYETSLSRTDLSTGKRSTSRMALSSLRTPVKRLEPSR